MKSYIVTVIPKFPAYDDKGARLEIYAKNRAEALKQARKEVFNECLYGRPDGPLIYRAVVAEEDVISEPLPPMIHVSSDRLPSQEIANRVAADVDAVDYGVSIKLVRDGDAYSYVISTLFNGMVRKHKLLASVTSEERLKAHAEGFIENMKK